MKRISREKLRDKLILAEKIVLVVALPEKYWNQSYLPGTLQIDHIEVDEKAPRLLSDKDAEIVVYCASKECQDSSIAALKLQNMGYKNVFEYVEGKKDWIEGGLPVR